MGPLDRWMQRFNPIPIDPELSTDAKELRLKPTFHPFPRLPAEIRVKIWAIALQDQYKERLSREDRFWTPVRVENNVTLFMNRDGFYVVTNRGYPTHFFVNREARAEAARCDGGAWLSFGDGTAEVYINFDKEDVRLHDSRTGALNDSLWSTGAWGILAKEAWCPEVLAETSEYGETVLMSHWVGHKKAGETT
ncbi:uncharacterized protein J4E92_010144 [Alternaria infectoria]|uniref:uncharacterized protein n=1 Tax=Alternaria infectoria TaxID=45303 RepID=UPI0022202263|nr:uncharacterized protein J4E92_010144 [Alternaria infectoria]KAI4912099.1 hypothetical protein J4E92_010144 [Alternaria infectoria]